VQQSGVSGGNVVAEKRVDFTYHDDSRVHTIARYNDTAAGSAHEIATATYSFDSLGRLTELGYKQGSANLFTPYSWTYDDVGRITQFATADGTSDYEYDQTNQLTAADHNYQSDESYSYDANGNRTGGGYTTGNDNRLTHDGTYSYTYDHEGNRTSRTKASTNEQTLYEWDHRNRLVSVIEKDDQGTTTQVVEYTYDVYNRRIGKAVDTTAPFNMADAAIERYVFDDLNGVTSVDGGNVVLDLVDTDGDGSTSIALERRQLYSNAVDQILAQENVTESISSADRVYWPLTDHLGTVRDLVTNDRALSEHYEYDSYGNVTSGDTTLTRYLFTSRELDIDTGLQNNRARWYDAATGRWINQDPLGFKAGDTNLSRYVSNGPLISTDASGLEERESSTNGVINLLHPLENEGSFYKKALKVKPIDGTVQTVGHGGAYSDTDARIVPNWTAPTTAFWILLFGA
jgi:RHS repeat-associated protein